MNSKLLRFLVLLLQSICLAMVVAVCVFGILVNEDSEQIKPYIISVVKASVIFLMTISYYKTSVSNFNPGNPFVILFLLFLSIAELRILSVFTGLTGWSILPPRVSVRLQLFAQFMIYFLMAGYAINYQNNDHSAVSRFMVMGTSACLFLSIIIPATQDIQGVWSLRAPYILFTTFGIVSIFTNIILASSEPTTAGVFRHVSTILMLIGNYASIMYSEDFTISMVGSGLFFIGGILCMILTLRNSILL